MYSCLDYESKEKKKENQILKQTELKRSCNQETRVSSSGSCIIVTFSFLIVKKKEQLETINQLIHWNTSSTLPLPLFVDSLSDLSRNSHVQTRTEYTLQSMIHEYYLRSNILITRIEHEKRTRLLPLSRFHGTCALADARVLLFRSIYISKEMSKSLD